MQINSVSNSKNFGMAKIANKTLIWEKVAKQMKKYTASNEIMQRNFDCIKELYPNKYLHTYEFGESVTFKISSIKNHFLAYITPAHIKYKDSYYRNTPVGIFTGLKLCLGKISGQENAQALKKEAKKIAKTMGKISKDNK